MENLMHTVYFGNPVSAYLTSIVFLVVGWAAVWVVSKIVLARLQRWAQTTETRVDDLIIHAVDSTLIPLIYVSVLMASVKSLALPPLIQKSLALLWALVVMISIVRAVLGIVRHVIYSIWLPKRPDHLSLERHMRTIMPVISFAVWSLALILLLDNMGFKITAVVAGLGITGIAVALAAQTVLGDLFGYVIIMLDKPFEIDDAIDLGNNYTGTVEHIGFKTTRVRSASGEQLIFSNKDLTDSRVRNYKRMQLRRIAFNLGVTYDTSSEKIRRATAMIEEIIKNTPKTRFDRSHFLTFADSSLIIETVYFVLSADYAVYVDVHQSINLKIKEAFEREGLEFAFPSRTVYAAKPATAAHAN